MGEIVSSLLGPDACVVRSILFDKTAESNWLVPWHRDETIAVAERIETPGFGPWSVKDGTPHVSSPRDVLDHMVTIRLHLDDCPADNGALRAMPGSHDDNAMEPDEARAVVCEAMAGDAVIMKPRILHASAKAVHPTRRRVLHLECAAIGLPHKLQWAEAHPLSR